MNNWRNIRLGIGRGTRTILPDGTIKTVPYHGAVIWDDLALRKEMLQRYRNKNKLNEAITNGGSDVDEFLAQKGAIMFGESGNNSYYVRFERPTRAALTSLVYLLPRRSNGNATIWVYVYGKGEETLTIDEFMEKYL